MIRVLTDHSGPRPADVRVDGNKVAFKILREAMTRADWTTHDYNVHFCVGLENTGNSSVDVELSIDGGSWEKLPARQPLLFAAQSPAGPFALADYPARSNLRKSYVVRIPLAPGDRRYVANTLVRTLDSLTAEFERLATAGDARREIIGRTLEGRDVVAYVYGNPDVQGSFLVTSGFHPPEPDTLASAAIMQFLSEPGGRALLDRIAVAVVPIANPDGYANGTQGSNAAGINFYWHFARELPDRCPEAAALWRFSRFLAPRGYIDFHCYTFQLDKQAGPYHRPLFFLDSPAARAACIALYRRLSTLPGYPVTGFSTFAPHTLGAMLADQFDTVALAKYHLHLIEGEEGCRARGLAVFRAMADSILETGVLGPAPRKKVSWRRPLRRSLTWWAGLLRPTIGRIRRGQFRRIRLDRVALVPASSEMADDVL